MRFLSRIVGPVVEAPRSPRERRPATRQRSRIELESLESRDLMTGIPGVSVQYGNLTIAAPLKSGNTAVVAIDKSNGYVNVSLNGQSEEFAPSLISSVTYEGGSGGGDTFTNNTAFTTLVYAYGSGDNITGGTGFNYVYIWGNGDTYDAQAGSTSDVFEIGSGDTVNNPYHASVQVYVF